MRKQLSVLCVLIADIPEDLIIEKITMIYYVSFSTSSGLYLTNVEYYSSDRSKEW